MPEIIVFTCMTSQFVSAGDIRVYLRHQVTVAVNETPTTDLTS